VFAQRIMREGGQSDEDRIKWAYQTATSREPDSFVHAQILQIFQNHHEHFLTAAEDAEKLIAVGSAPIAKELNAAELAAWTSVARVVLNLRETFTRY